MSNMNSVIKARGLWKCKSLTGVASKIRDIDKKQEEQVCLLSLRKMKI